MSQGDAPINGGEGAYPPFGYAWYVAAIITLGYAFAFMDRIIVGTLTPAIQADLHINDTQAGYLQGLAFAVFYTTFGLPLGWFADRGNRKRLLAIGMTGWSVMTSACGLVRGFPLIFLARIGVGIGEATLSPCTSSLLSDYFPPRTRAWAFGLFVSGTSIGTFLSFTGGGLIYSDFIARGGLTLPLVGLLKPWQATFFIVGLPGLIPALLLALTVREPARLGRAKAESGAAILPYYKTNAASLICHHVGIAMFFVSVYGFLAWLPTFFLRSFGWDPAVFSIRYGLLGSSLGLVGALSAGFVGAALKRNGDAIGTMRACALGAMLAATGATLTALMPTGESAFVAYLITGFFSNYASVLGLTAITEMAPNEIRARITATYVLCTGLISATLGPLLVGVISDALRPDPQGIAHGLAIVSGGVALPGAILIGIGWKSYRATLARMP